MSDGMAERKMGTALAKALPTATPAPKSSFPVQSPEVSRLQRTIGELGNALKAGAITVPAHAINLRVALEGAVRVRGSISDKDRNLLAELEPRARALLSQADAARDSATKTESVDASDFRLDWDVVTDIFDQMAPGMGPAVKLAPQAHRDAFEAMTRSPLFAQQIFEEAWDDIKDHWFELIQFTATMIAAEVAVGIFVAVPEPTMGTKIAAFVLQALILAFAIHAAYTANSIAIAYGTEFWSKVTAANGDAKKIDEAALAFMRLVFALFQTVAAAAGIGKAAKFRKPGDAPPPGSTRDGSDKSNTGSTKGTDTTSNAGGEQSTQKSSAARQGAESTTSSAQALVFNVSRDQLRVSTHRSSNAWGFDIDAPLPDGRSTRIANAYVETDAKGAPLGGPQFTIDKTGFVDGVEGKVQVYQGSTKVSLTDLVLDEAIQRYRQEFGHRPESLPGTLAWENKLNFQRAYARAVSDGMTSDAAKQFAIRDISFGRSRATRGYGDFSVQASNYAPVDLGGSLGTQNVPTKIYVEARRTK